ncbi:MAG TPA: helix-turn-helix transcriptional regulator [Candidatus Acidoferrales bacterium]|nr:helix-turn-helix transcriptional regulator [Candidatus Acidoferrales bacterium]
MRGRPPLTEEQIKTAAERGVRVAIFMRDQKYTERKLAEELDVSRRTIQMIKSGRATPHRETLSKLEGLLAKHERARS